MIWDSEPCTRERSRMSCTTKVVWYTPQVSSGAVRTGTSTPGCESEPISDCGHLKREAGGARVELHYEKDCGGGRVWRSRHRRDGRAGPCAVRCVLLSRDGIRYVQPSIERSW